MIIHKSKLRKVSIKETSQQQLLIYVAKPRNKAAVGVIKIVQNELCISIGWNIPWNSYEFMI